MKRITKLSEEAFNLDLNFRDFLLFFVGWYVFFSTDSKLGLKCDSIEEAFARVSKEVFQSVWYESYHSSYHDRSYDSWWRRQ